MCRSFGKHVYWNSGTTIVNTDWESAEYLVVDDVEWEYFVGKKCFLGCQRNFILTEKYVKKTPIKFGKPCIYLCNEDPREAMSMREETYYADNVDYVVLGNDKLY